jgi:hypothetical protein
MRPKHSHFRVTFVNASTNSVLIARQRVDINRGHLQALKLRDLKLFCPSLLRSLKDRKIKVRI